MKNYFYKSHATVKCFTNGIFLTMMLYIPFKLIFIEGSRILTEKVKLF